DRRGFVGEAAGVLKHRKRKEKALRKLESTEGNLTRLADLLTEIRRQLKPLGRQAEVARKAAVVQADVRDARARLLADDLVQLRAIVEQELADESILLDRRTRVEQALEEARLAEAALEAALREDLPALARAQETWYALSGLRERLKGTAGLAAERVRNAATIEPVPEGRDPDELEAQAAEVRAQEEAIATEIAGHRTVLDSAVESKQRAETAHAEEETRVSGLQRAAADRREGLARLHGQVNAIKSRAAAADDELSRLTLALEETQARFQRATHDFTALETRIAGLDAGEEGLDAEHEGAASTLADIEDRLLKIREEAQQADRERGALAARKEALELGLSRKDGAGALLAATEPVSGLLGSVAALLHVRHGYESAVAAALGNAADAVAFADVDTALDAIGRLRSEDLGRAGMLLGSARVDDGSWPGLPATATYATDVIDCPADLRPAVSRLLFKVAVVDDVEVARALVAELPDITAVTRDGDLIGSHFVSGGSSAQPSLLEVQAAVDEATEQLTEVTHRCERLGFDLARLEEERAQAQQRVDVALAKLHESDATLAAVAEELAQYGSQARAARAEGERIERAIAEANQARERDLAGLADLEARLVAAEETSDEEPDTTLREELAEAARAARQHEMESRLALRTAEERGRALVGRADALLRAAQAEREARAAAIARRERLIREGEVARAVTIGVARVLAKLETSIELAARERVAVEESRRGREQELLAVRSQLRDLGKELDELVAGVHRDEMARTQQRMRIEQLQERALEELGLEAEVLVAEYGPDQLVPPSIPVPDSEHSAEGSEPLPEPVPYDRDEQTKRLRTAERQLSMLGKVNPLALEEFSAMEERHKFLTEQLEDLKKTRRDLLDIVREVDERVEQVFTAAWEDVKVAFEAVFSRLFPGGEGRLVLTDPGNMLTTGIEVEARPPGKKVKRLSLLSGGERSLVAVAFLVALFKARPSPFYILDEVEAALDDTNLGRLLEIYEELRETSQLLVITHQKRTMEIGDALYGVTMRGDGVSAVISQRLREEASA
ncbi:MAG: chromosome segregation protein SMC, partial [Nocardioidaceae bacterium]